MQDLLKRTEPTEEHLEGLERALLCITPEREENYPSVLDALPVLVFDLVERLYRAAPERAQRLLHDAHPNVRNAAALAMALNGAAVPSEAVIPLTEAFVAQAGGVRHDDRIDIDTLVDQLGTTETLAAAGVEVLKDDERSLVSVYGLREALRIAPPDVIPGSLQRFLRHNSYPDSWGRVREALSQRDDLEAVARAIPTTGMSGTQADVVRLIVYPLFDTLPEGLEDHPSFFKLFVPELVVAYSEVLKALGETRAVALARRAMDDDQMRPSKREWIPLLAAVFGASTYGLVQEAVAQGLTANLSLAPEEARG